MFILYYELNCFARVELVLIEVASLLQLVSDPLLLFITQFSNSRWYLRAKEGGEEVSGVVLDSFFEVHAYLRWGSSILYHAV